MANLGALPRLAAFSASIAQSVWKSKLLKDDGTPYAAFDQFKPWVDSVAVQRDKLNETRVFANGLKTDLDAHAVRLNKHDARLDVLEARPVTTFP